MMNYSLRFESGEGDLGHDSSDMRVHLHDDTGTIEIPPDATGLTIWVREEQP